MGMMGLEDQDRQHQQQQKKMKDAAANKGGAAEDSPMVLNPGDGRDGLKALEVGYGGNPDESPVE
jgi:hypothetical protein